VGTNFQNGMIDLFPIYLTKTLRFRHARKLAGGQSIRSPPIFLSAWCALFCFV
jgi:hypothetical protein